MIWTNSYPSPLLIFALNPKSERGGRAPLAGLDTDSAWTAAAGGTLCVEVITWANLGRTATAESRLELGIRAVSEL